MLNASFNSFKKEWNFPKRDETARLQRLDRVNNKTYIKSRGYSLENTNELTNDAMLKSYYKNNKIEFLDPMQ